MRVVAVVAGTGERDAVLAGLTIPEHPRLARLAPYAETRVAECGVGTLVLLTARPDGTPGGTADAACATGIAVNRLLPDLVLGIDVQAGPTTFAGDDWLVALAQGRVPGSAEGQAGPVAAGAAAAAAAHRRPFLALAAAGTDGLQAAVGPLLASELR
ncbi:hypothetical protein EV189_2959 [Motilibacter rhizosphaerae]|uniref:Uncharacterized protein n=1 Tax=Motilibacter rhizosphaerae TaxID=598652 RepID=A0A4Q7NQY5_9ACTN|nr:hypothetical protein [Motilibacter rhizosphaerae]RZS87528.1 hypothetical protein EV189_2959 [Motilibacter rhizosphaerae]